MQIDRGACRSDLCYDTLGRMPNWMGAHLGIKTGGILLLAYMQPVTKGSGGVKVIGLCDVTP